MKPEQLLTVEPEVLLQRAEALELFGEIAEVERLVEASRVTPESLVVPQHLREAAERVDVRVPAEPVRSHRPWVGPLIIASKRVFRAAFQPFINELLRTQVSFNERIVGALSLLNEQVERQVTQDRRWRAEIERRLEAIERNPAHEQD